MPATNQPDAATQIEIFTTMALLKSNDTRVRKMVSAGQLIMPYYSYRGQEAIPAAAFMHLSDEDYLCTTYRGIHDALSKGLSLKELWSELAGRTTGTCKGKGGSMHITDTTKGVMVTSGIVGGTMPIANGIAWGSKLSGNARVTVATFGDGASNIGAFHEALNLASVWKLPVIFLCQNNRYAEHTPYSKGTSAQHVADRAAAYSMPGLHIDGNDPVEVYGAMGEAVARARAGDGPTLVEAMTFRFHGHVFGDAASYIPESEKQAAEAADPYPLYRARLTAGGIASEERLSAIEAAVEAQIDEAMDFAFGAPFPDLTELTTDVYGEAA